jgi:hypothetical protein
MNSTESSALIAVSGSDTAPITVQLSVRYRPAKQAAEYSGVPSDALAGRAAAAVSRRPVAQLHRAGA